MSVLQSMLVVVLLFASVSACGYDGSRFEERGDRYSADGDHLDARVEYELALERAGDEAPFTLVLKAAAAALASKDFEAAGRRFDALVRARPEFAERAAAIYQLHAERWLAAADTFAAVRALDWLVASDSTRSLDRLHYVLGDIAFERPAYDEAAVSYRLGLARDPRSATPSVYARLGEIAGRERNCAAAVSYLRRYLELAGREGDAASDARYGLGNCALRLAERAFSQGDYTRAMDYVQTMIVIGEPAGKVPDAELLTARLHERFGNREAAMTYYEKIVDGDETMRSRPAVEAYRRLKQLEFGMPLADGESNRGADGAPSGGEGES